MDGLRMRTDSNEIGIGHATAKGLNYLGGIAAAAHAVGKA